MSREIPTIKGATYVVTPTADGTVTAPDGTVIASFVVGAQTTFVAPVKRVIVSDDNASVDIYFNPAAPAGSGGGRMNNRELEQHLEDASRHLSASERAHLESWVPDFSEPEPSVPEGALSPAVIRRHFALNAQPGAEGVPAASTAPAAVYISRVPWARWEGDAETGQWVNNASTVDESVFGLARKLMDNAGLQHKCSTDTVEGVDDYNGKLWPFYWQHANYITDEYGIKHLTAISGIHESFDPCTNNVAAFGPAFWFFCCLEHSKKEDGTWNTHDGTENGTPLFQLWGISARPWEELDETRRVELAALGITAADFHLWPECQQWDAAAGNLVPRSYWCHSAYCGGADLQEDGTYMLASKRNLPVFNRLSHKAINALYGGKSGGYASGCVNAFGLLFDIVKNATKDSQSIHYGMSANNKEAVLASVDTGQPDYVFPIAEQGNFRPGCSVWLWQEDKTSLLVTYKRSISVQVGRITAIETRTLELADGSSAESLCLVIDPATVQPFVTRTSVEEANVLTEAGQFACCYATQGLALAGETDVVLGKHDGARTSFSDGYHPYRVQGTEFMAGIYVCAADVVAALGDGVSSVQIDGTVCVPTTEQYIILHAGMDVARVAASSLAVYLSRGYVPVGIFEARGGVILNMQLTRGGVAFPTAAGGRGSATGKGHSDFLYANRTSMAEVMLGGDASTTVNAGSATWHINCGLSTADKSFGARD